LQIDENVEREIVNHRSLSHPHIIKFKEVIETLFFYLKIVYSSINVKIIIAILGSYKDLGSS
jgi:hypothetical protein